MGRPKKVPLSPEEVRSLSLDERERLLNEREKSLDARDAILMDMPEGDMSSVDVKNWFAKTRKDRLAAMLVIATTSPNEKTRRDMLVLLDAMDVGKPGMKKRTDSDDVEGVIIQHGTYGIE